MPDADGPPRGPARRAVLRGVLAGVLLAGALEVVNVLAGPNTHEVVPGLVYRTSQPSGARLERLVRGQGIRTVVNFRGVSDDAAWYRDECRAAAKYGVSLEDFNGCSSGRLPSVRLVRELVRVLDECEYPVLFHCNRGIDRTGLASALYLLLKTDTPLPAALRHLGPRYCHLPFGRTGHIDRFFDLYQDWLAGREHSRELFRRWATREYTAGEGSAEITLLGLTGVPPASASYREDEDGPLVLPALKACGVRVRCRNTSAQTWPMRPGQNAGVHALYYVDDENGKGVAERRAGLFEAEVRPGESVDLTLSIPRLEAGRYLLRVDMVNPQHALFLQVGSRPLFVPLEVR